MSDLRKAKIKEDFNRAFLQLTEGCGRAVCFNPDCYNDPYTERMAKQMVVKHLLEKFKKEEEGGDGVKWCRKLPDLSVGVSSEALSLQLTFSTPDILGACFLDSWEGDGRPGVSESRPAISFEEVSGQYEQATELVRTGRLSQWWFQEAIGKMTFDTYTTLFLPRTVLILLENPDLILPEYSPALEAIMKLVLGLSEAGKRTVVRWLSGYAGDRLVKLVYVFQQFITVRMIEATRKNLDEGVISAIQTLDLLHQSNHPSEQVSYKEFYNDAVNKEMNLRYVYSFWKARPHQFSVLQYPWILDSATKTRLLEEETMYEQQKYQSDGMMRAMMQGFREYSPYLILHVRRDSLIPDTITNLQHQDSSLKKPLKVHFINEEGVDGGGLQKEFFQLITRQLFDPQFSMFTHYEDTRLFYFNPDTVASMEEFALIGKILGLAIYNSNILDVHLPLGVYKKLLGGVATVDDLEVFNPQLARGLKEVLTMDGDVEMVLCRTFEVETHAYGAVIHHELKPGGAQTPVTNENRQEYVQLYVDWVLNQGVKEPFQAFQSGFLKVCGGELLSMFRPEELELLICGNPVLDFHELEKACVYEDGYTRDSPTCRLLWQVLHTLSTDQQKKFLFFVTGSDRAPINGLGSMRFVISRNGPDSDRLMTAHTCFNHLLLPEYRTEQKVRHMLLLAINNSEGFGLR